MDAANPGGLGGTYAGNPLGIAAANAVLDVIEEENLCARANELGSRLKQRLEADPRHHARDRGHPRPRLHGGRGIRQPVDQGSPTRALPTASGWRRRSAG
jgi:hypothetical protein